MSDKCGEECSDGSPCEWPEGDKGPCPWHSDKENEPNPGRDTKLTKEREEKIAQAIENGKSMNSAARKAGVTPQTVHNWLDRGKSEDNSIFAEFFERIARAKGHGEDFYFNLALELAKENEDHRFIASLMKQRYPDSWGETETGVDSDTVTVQISEQVASTWPE